MPSTLTKLLNLLRRQDGFAVPTAMLMVFAAMGVVAVGTVTSVQLQSGSTRDQQTKTALQLAETGVTQALLHFNRYDPDVGNACSPLGGTGPDAGGWCPQQSGSLDGGSYTYYARPIDEAELQIVSMGQRDGVTRRVHVTAHSSSGQPVFADATVISDEGIHLDSFAYVNSHMATNGSVTMESNAEICGDIHHGVGESITSSGNATQTCGGQDDGGANLAPVNQGDAATVNDNSRLFGQDLISGQPFRACFDGVLGDGAAGECGGRHLDLQQNASVTLGGAKYSFCKLTMSSNTALYVQAGKQVLIYFDSPEACGYADDEQPIVQVDMASNARITSTDGGPANVALLFVGSDTIDTRANLSSNTSVGAGCEQNFVAYGPKTDLLLNSNSTYCGALAGKTVELDSNARLYVDALSQSWVLPNTPPHYEVDRFVECTAAPASPPTTGC